MHVAARVQFLQDGDPQCKADIVLQSFTTKSIMNETSRPTHADIQSPEKQSTA
jgi:hypothetical protein